MQSSINYIKSKIDLLIAGFLDQPVIPIPDIVVNHGSKKIHEYCYPVCFLEPVTYVISLTT